MLSPAPPPLTAPTKTPNPLTQASQLAWITPKGAPGKGAKAGAGGPVVAARVQGSPASAHVAHGAPLRPTLTKVPCESASGEPAGLVTLHASGGVVETPSAAPARGPGADKTILGVDNAGMAAALRPAVGKRGRAEEGEGSDGGDGEDDDDEEEEEEEDEQLREREATLGERVAALEREMQMGLGVSGGSGGGEEEEEEEDGGVAGQRVQEAVRADSLGVLLTQALR